MDGWVGEKEEHGAGSVQKIDDWIVEARGRQEKGNVWTEFEAWGWVATVERMARRASTLTSNSGRLPVMPSETGRPETGRHIDEKRSLGSVYQAHTPVVHRRSTIDQQILLPDQRCPVRSHTWSFPAVGTWCGCPTGPAPQATAAWRTSLFDVAM